ncbi:hypothetical protein GC56T3_0563 [Geobacillus sp. C56-T3]|nr:hypothetical protein GC56T3_0563 [Geobacillus sp. C56-T3]
MDGKKRSWTGGSSEKRWPPPYRVLLEWSRRSDKMLGARMCYSFFSGFFGMKGIEGNELIDFYE